MTNNPAVYVALDCEMGGIDLHYSLLQAYFVALDKNLQIVSELNLLTKPDDGIYHICAQGLAVNGIDLVKHDAVAVTYSNARSELGSWFRKINNGQQISRLRALGHNVHGDIRHIWDKIYARTKWENFVGYRNIDTATICQYLKDCGKIPQSVDGPEGVSGSLKSLADHFHVPYESEKLHDARADTLLTVDVYRCMLKL